jgi:HK97 family phage major capsid protein
MSRKAALQAMLKELEPEGREIREMLRKAEAEKRDVTPAEKQRVDAYLEKIRPINDALDQVAADDALMEKAKAFGASVGIPGAGHNPDNSKRLSFHGMATRVAKQMVPGGAKALAPSGAAVVGQEFTGDPVALGRVATGLLDVLPVVAHAGPEFAYLRQTARTNLAAVVSEGATKPTTVLGVTRVEASLVVVAHLSEGVPRFWLLDTVALESFIDAELRFGLGVALEAKVLADIAATSGIQTQAYTTSVLATVRKAVTKLEVAGHVAASIVLHPSDWEGIELALASTNAVEHLSLPYDPATRRLFGVPVVTTVSATAGVGYALADQAVAVDTDTQGVGVQWSESSNATDFAQNLIRARCEGRFATSVYSPLGVVQADLTA